MKSIDLFWHIIKNNEDNPEQCWNWTGCLVGRSSSNGIGYGVLQFNGVKWYAHRYAYTKLKGKIGNSFVLHKCDNPACINPNHLELGDNRKNIQDYWDRLGNERKENARIKKLILKEIIRKEKKRGLTDIQIRLVFELRNKGMKMKDIGIKLNVSESYISLILNGKRKVNYY